MLPTVILPGYLESASVYLPLAQTLTDRGSPTTVVPIKFWDWVPTIGGRSMVPILRLLQQTVTKSLTNNQVSPNQPDWPLRWRLDLAHFHWSHTLRYPQRCHRSRWLVELSRFDRYPYLLGYSSIQWRTLDKKEHEFCE
jgi:hypothetical protein